MKKIIISEQQYHLILSKMLCEDQESKAQNLGIKQLMVSKGCNRQEAQALFNDLRNAFPSVRLPLYTNSNGTNKGTYKFLTALVRMFINGELENTNVKSKLDDCLSVISSDEYVNEFNEDLNGLSADEIISNYYHVVEDRNKAERENEMDLVANEEYDIVRIPNFQTATQYGEYNDWCVCHEPHQYRNYTDNGRGIFYFCLKKGFENVPKKATENAPLDEYGLSMIAVSVKEDGSPHTISCRWNHKMNGNDNVMTPSELSQIIGRNYFETFLPRHDTSDNLNGLIGDIIQYLRKYDLDTLYDYHVSDEYNDYGDDAIILLNPQGDIYSHATFKSFDADEDYYDYDEDYDEFENDGESYIDGEAKTKYMISSRYWVVNSSVVDEDVDSWMIYDSQEDKPLDGILYDNVEWQNGDFIRVYKDNKVKMLTLDGKPNPLGDENYYFQSVYEGGRGFAVVVNGNNHLKNLYNNYNKSFVFDEWYYEIDIKSQTWQGGDRGCTVKLTTTNKQSITVWVSEDGNVDFKNEQWQDDEFYF